MLTSLLNHVHRRDLPVRCSEGMERQLENLTQEHASLRVVPVQAASDDTPKEDEASARPAQSNNKLKRALQSVQDKIHQAGSARPELFEGVGDDTIDRLDHLINAVIDQAVQLDLLRDQLNK